MGAGLFAGWTPTHRWLAAFAVFGLFLPAGLSGLVFVILFMIGVAVYTARKIAPQADTPEPEIRVAERRVAERPATDRRATIRAAALQPAPTRTVGRTAAGPWGQSSAGQSSAGPTSAGPTARPASRPATTSAALFAQAPQQRTTAFTNRGFDAEPANAFGRTHARPSPEMHAFVPAGAARPAPQSPPLQTPSVPRPTSFARRLLGKIHPQAYAYLRAFLGLLLTLGALSALKAGSDPSTGPMATLNILFPVAYIAAVTSPILIPVIIAVTKFIRAWGVRRGWSDALVGVVMTSIYWLPCLLDAPSKGAMSALSALGIAVSGAVGGFEFWRAEGYPEARRSTARLLGTFKDGFMQGLGR